MALPNVIDDAENKAKQLEDQLNVEDNFAAGVEDGIAKPINSLADNVTSGFGSLSDMLGKVDTDMPDNVSEGVDNSEMSVVLSDSNDLLSVIASNTGNMLNAFVDWAGLQEFQAQKVENVSANTTDESPVKAAEKSIIDSLLSGGLFGLGTIIPSIVAGLSSLAIPALIVGAIGAGIVEGIMSWDVAEQLAETTGASGGVAGFTQLFTGTGDSLISAFGNAARWAGAGFLIGGPVGALVGGVLGAAVSAITHFVGFDNIVAGVQWAVDKAHAAIELFTGTNVERAKQRLDEVNSSIVNSERKNHELESERQQINEAISEARSTGNLHDIELLQERLVDVNSRIEENNANNESLRRQSNQWQDKIDNAHKGVFGWFKDVAGTVTDFVSSIPARLFDVVIAPFVQIADMFGFEIDVDGINASITNFVKSIPGKIVDSLTNSFNTIYDFFTNEDFRNSILATAAAIPGKFVDLVLDTFNRIFNAIKDALSGIGGFIGNSVLNIFGWNDSENKSVLDGVDLPPVQVYYDANGKVLEPNQVFDRNVTKYDNTGNVIPESMLNINYDALSEPLTPAIADYRTVAQVDAQEKIIADAVASGVLDEQLLVEYRSINNVNRTNADVIKSIGQLIQGGNVNTVVQTNNNSNIAVDSGLPLNPPTNPYDGQQ